VRSKFDGNVALPLTPIDTSCSWKVVVGTVHVLPLHTQMAVGTSFFQVSPLHFTFRRGSTIDSVTGGGPTVLAVQRTVDLAS
jgi:hypothetical protein